MNRTRSISGCLAVLLTAAYFIATRASAPGHPPDFRDAPGSEAAFRDLTGGSIYTADLPVPVAAYSQVKEKTEDGELGPFPEKLAFIMRPPADRGMTAPVMDFFSAELYKSIESRPDIPYFRIAAKESAKQGVDLELILAIIMKESNFNPKAYNTAYGASGLMQLLPDTAKWLGLKETKKIWEPAVNIKYGVKYLKYLAVRLGEDGFDISALKPDAVAKDRSLRRVIAAYNAGPGNVEKYMGEKYAAKHDGIPPFKETLDYLAKVDVYFRSFKDQGLTDLSPIPPPAR